MNMNKKLLLINSSANLETSFSRKLTKLFIKEWLIKFSNTIITERDVAVNKVPLLDNTTLDAIRTNKEDNSLSPAGHEARQLSEDMINELMAADTIIFGVPMYNFSIPASLKAYIDYIARSGVTFGYDAVEKKTKGFLIGKKVVVIATSGGFYQNSNMDFQAPYLKALFSYIGLDEDLTFIRAQGMLHPVEVVEKSLQEAETEIRAYIAKL